MWLHHWCGSCLHAHLRFSWVHYTGTVLKACSSCSSPQMILTHCTIKQMSRMAGTMLEGASRNRHTLYLKSSTETSGSLFYLVLVNLDNNTDHWWHNSLYSFQFPAKVRAKDRYRTVLEHSSPANKDWQQDMEQKTQETVQSEPLIYTDHLCKVFLQLWRNLAFGSGNGCKQCKNRW